ncbi:hypothetical protein D0Z00_001818 [Geotrichum galactomycetum]|uniref:Uncharacterized protein n=1 Tax=Geotrichum galactomycetum TaxID=27317 RepID=A0ACB6V5T0_9ASCO|nr:hypothetical protein D0Z00_001818 [Geotrichum candidum]
MDKGFSSILRNSRLATLPKVRASGNAKVVPQGQVIHTTPASLHRKDFGLKRTMPERFSTPYITVDALDGYEGMTKFDYGSSFYLKHKRFQELGIPSNPKFFEAEKVEKRLGDIKPMQFKRMLANSKAKRSIALKTLAQSNISLEPRNSSALSDGVARVYNITKPTQPFAASSPTVRANAGLGFLLKGSLATAPASSSRLSGVSSVYLSKPVPARSVVGRQNSTSVAVGGFIARAVTTNQNTEKPVNVIVQSCTIRPNGGVTLSTVSAPQQNSSNTSLIGTFHRSPSRNANPGDKWDILSK